MNPPLEANVSGRPGAEGPIIHLAPWWDPDLARLGHAPTSNYVETFWTPILGPAALLSLRLANTMFQSRAGGFEIPLREFAARIGLGARRGRHSPAVRGLERLEYFGLATTRERLLIRTHVPDLPDHLRKRLPRELRREHHHVHERSN